MLRDQQLDVHARELERIVLESQEKLCQSREEILGELAGMRDAIGSSTRELETEVENLADQVDSGLEQLERRLGELNFLLAEKGLEDLAGFDAERDGLLEAFHDLIATLEAAGERGANVSSSHENLMVPWRAHRVQLERTREDLLRSEEAVTGELAQLREDLRENLADREASRGEVPEVVLRIVEGTGALGPWIQAIFQVPEEASPQTPEEAGLKPRV